MAAHFATVTEKEIRQMNEETTPATKNLPVWLILKQLSPSVSVPSDLDIYLATTRFGKYQSLVTTTSGNSY